MSTSTSTLTPDQILDQLSAALYNEPLTFNQTYHQHLSTTTTTTPFFNSSHDLYQENLNLSTSIDSIHPQPLPQHIPLFRPDTPNTNPNSPQLNSFEPLHVPSTHKTLDPTPSHILSNQSIPNSTDLNQSSRSHLHSAQELTNDQLNQPGDHQNQIPSLDFINELTSFLSSPSTPPTLTPHHPHHTFQQSACTLPSHPGMTFSGGSADSEPLEPSSDLDMPILPSQKHYQRSLARSKQASLDTVSDPPKLSKTVCFIDSNGQSYYDQVDAPHYPKIGQVFQSLDAFKLACSLASWPRGHGIHLRSNSKPTSRRRMRDYSCSRDRLPPNGVNCGFRIRVSSEDGERTWTVFDLNLVHSNHDPQPGDYKLSTTQQKLLEEQLAKATEIEPTNKDDVSYKIQPEAPPPRPQQSRSSLPSGFPSPEPHTRPLRHPSPPALEESPSSPEMSAKRSTKRSQASLRPPPALKRKHDLVLLDEGSDVPEQELNNHRALKSTEWVTLNTAQVDASLNNHGDRLWSGATRNLRRKAFHPMLPSSPSPPPRQRTQRAKKQSPETSEDEIEIVSRPRTGTHWTKSKRKGPPEPIKVADARSNQMARHPPSQRPETDGSNQPGPSCPQRAKRGRGVTMDFLLSSPVQSSTGFIEDLDLQAEEHMTWPMRPARLNGVTVEDLLEHDGPTHDAPQSDAPADERLAFAGSQHIIKGLPSNPSVEDVLGACHYKLVRLAPRLVQAGYTAQTLLMAEPQALAQSTLCLGESWMSTVLVRRLEGRRECAAGRGSVDAYQRCWCWPRPKGGPYPRCDHCGFWKA